MIETRTKVLLADDHTMFLEGLAALLSHEKQIAVLGTARNGEGILALLRKHPTVDVVVTDISMAGMGGQDLSKRIRQSYPEVQILVLSMHTDPVRISKLLEAGVNGYMLKSAGHKMLVEAIATVSQGRPYFCPTVKDIFIMSRLKGRPTRPALGEAAMLTGREHEVLRLIYAEHTNGEIAEMLCISLHTVETHRANILRKLGARNTAGLVKHAIQRGLV